MTRPEFIDKLSNILDENGVDGLVLKDIGRTPL
jgi:hypothetical protein